MRRNKRKRFGKRAVGAEDMVLQITSMADIFTIILVFLLKSFATGTTSISPGHDILLPESVAFDPVTEMTKLEISQNGVLIDDKQVADLVNYRFRTSQLESDGSSRSLNVLLHDKARAPASFNENGQEKSSDPSAPAQPPGMLVLADKKTPYTTLKTVLDTLSLNGYADFKLVVVEDQ